MTYQATVHRLADTTEDALMKALDGNLSGDLSDFDMRVHMVRVLMMARHTAVALADTAVAAELSRLWGRFVAPIGLEDVWPGEAAMQAVDETVASDQWKVNAAAAIAVMGRAQVTETTQTTYQTGMAEHGVEYWTRDVEPNACELCQDLADGIMPTSTPMYHHKGCGCTQKPIK